MRALLDRAESLFLARQFDAALECSLHVLQQLMGYEPSCSDSTELVTASAANAAARDAASTALTVRSIRLPSSGLIDHACADGCVCEACVVLIIQILHESGARPLVDPFLARCYPLTKLCPYAVFAAWFACSCAEQNDAECDAAVARTLDYWYDDFSALLPRARLTNAQREGLLLQILFQALLASPAHSADCAAAAASTGSDTSSTPALRATPVAERIAAARQHVAAATAWLSGDLASKVLAHIDSVERAHAATSAAAAAARQADRSSAQPRATRPLDSETSSSLPTASGSDSAAASAAAAADSSAAGTSTALVGSFYGAGTLLDRVQRAATPLVNRLRASAHWCHQQMTILARQLLSSSNAGPRNQRRRTVAARVALLAVLTAVFWWIVRRLISLVSQTSLASAVRRQLGDMYKLAFSHSFGRFL